MLTRKMLMNKECTHREYYEGILDSSGFRPPVTREDLTQLAIEYMAGNRALNSLDCTRYEHRRVCGLPYWNRVSLGESGGCSAAVGQAFRDRGDFATQAGLVSLAKAWAIKEIESMESDND